MFDMNKIAGYVIYKVYIIHHNTDSYMFVIFFVSAQFIAWQAIHGLENFCSKRIQAPTHCKLKGCGENHRQGALPAGGTWRYRTHHVSVTPSVAASHCSVPLIHFQMERGQHPAWNSYPKKKERKLVMICHDWIPCRCQHHAWLWNIWYSTLQVGMAATWPLAAGPWTSTLCRATAPCAAQAALWERGVPLKAFWLVVFHKA